MVHGMTLQLVYKEKVTTMWYCSFLHVYSCLVTEAQPRALCAQCIFAQERLRGAHAHESYCSQFVCLSICLSLSVTNLVLAYDVRATNYTYQRSLRWTPKVFKNADFVKELSFPSYSLFFAFAGPRWPFAIIDSKFPHGHVQLTTITYEC